jgi:uncharacterized protein (DUF1800 family)
MPSVAYYSRPLDAKAAEHLLRRTMFGASRSDIAQLTGKTAAQALDTLLADQAAPEPPIDPNTGQVWVTQPRDTMGEGRRFSSLRAWWLNLMLTQPISLREKMTLFWQNHFVSTYSTVNDARYMYAQNALLRRHALGNIRTFVRDITYDPAMLRYLNGNTNRVGAAQENYARELLELFTIGKGPEIAPFNYTNYTEDDVRAAARVLTGWVDNATTIRGEFNAARHDTTDKRFSAAFQNTVIRGRTGANAGMDELNDLLDMIFRQAETARFLVRKFYRFFVNFEITPEIERDIIEPVAQTLRSNNYEVKPALRQLLSSEHFFEENIRGAMIKTPLDLIIGGLRQFEIVPPGPNNMPPAPNAQTPMTPQLAINANYAMMDRLRGTSATMQMDVHEQPNVAGWPAYYQEPAFYQLWVNTATMPTRGQFADLVLNNMNVNAVSGVNASGAAQFVNVRAYSGFDSVAFVSRLPNPQDPYKMMDALCENFFAVDLTQAERVELVTNVLMPGLPDYEWTTQWNDFIRDMAPTKRAAVKARLDNVVRYLISLAEYQVC